MQRMQAPARDPVLYRVLLETEPQQLIASHDPMLPPRQLRNLCVPSRLTRFLSPRPWKCAYTTIFYGLAGHGPHPDGPGRAFGARFVPLVERKAYEREEMALTRPSSLLSGEGHLLPRCHYGLGGE
jgi:hypothetical protein